MFPKCRQYHVGTAQYHKSTNVPLILKVQEIIFLPGAKHIMGHFLQFFRGGLAFFEPSKCPIICFAREKKNFSHFQNQWYFISKFAVVCSQIKVPIVLAQHIGNKRIGETQKFICRASPTVTELTYLFRSTEAETGILWKQAQQEVRQHWFISG